MSPNGRQGASAHTGVLAENYFVLRPIRKHGVGDSISAIRGRKGRSRPNWRPFGLTSFSASRPPGSNLKGFASNPEQLGRSRLNSSRCPRNGADPIEEQRVQEAQPTVALDRAVQVNVEALRERVSV